MDTTQNTIAAIIGNHFFNRVHNFQKDKYNAHIKKQSTFFIKQSFGTKRQNDGKNKSLNLIRRTVKFI